MIGVTRADGVVDVAMLEHAIRDDLDKNAPRAMAVLRPLKVVLTNVAENHFEELVAKGHPHRDDLPERRLPFGREIYIDQDDFREEANKKYKRLVLGKRVRLRNAYVIEAEGATKDSNGNIVEIQARLIADTLGKDPEDGNKPKGVIQWVAAHRCAELEVRLYDRLFTDPAPDAGDKNFLDCINSESLTVLYNGKGEISLLDSVPGMSFQFEREGYFCRDADSQNIVFNLTIGLKDSWGKGEDL
jgi:glutaminyl-tRNA synthetase